MTTNAGYAGDVGSIPGLGDPLEKKMATYASILAWRIPGTEKEAWWAAVHGFAKNQTRLSESDMTIVNSMSTYALHHFPSIPPHLPPNALSELQKHQCSGHMQRR